MESKIAEIQTEGIPKTKGAPSTRHAKNRILDPFFP
jgi:hypothetical protein